jgi:hypothetical protein
MFGKALLPKSVPTKEPESVTHRRKSGKPSFACVSMPCRMEDEIRRVEGPRCDRCHRVVDARKGGSGGRR